MEVLNVKANNCSCMVYDELVARRDLRFLSYKT